MFLSVDSGLMFERGLSSNMRLIPQLTLDRQELVELGDAVGAAPRPGFDQPRARCHRQIGDGGVFALARTVRNKAAIVVLLGKLNRIYGLSHRTDLIELDEN